MKRHTFKVIQWLGQDASPDRFAVVEVDRLGPVLRAGPYVTMRYANARANQLQRRADRPMRAERRPSR